MYLNLPYFSNSLICMFCMMMGHFKCYKIHLEKSLIDDRSVEYMNAGRSYGLYLLNTFILVYVKLYNTA